MLCANHSAQFSVNSISRIVHYQVNSALNRLTDDKWQFSRRADEILYILTEKNTPQLLADQQTLLRLLGSWRSASASVKDELIIF
jgi:hypothetical protein